MYSHILIATDGSELSGRAVSHGLALAKATGAKITVATVTPEWSPREMASRVTLGEQFPTNDFEQDAINAARAILADAAAKAAAAGVACEVLHVPDHQPAAGILKAANDCRCDLIVMSTHGRFGLARMVVGSQASDVLAGATTPVLICP